MLRGKRILIVEDELLIALDIAAAIEEAGAQIVGPAASVREALHLIETEKIDGAILDVQLGAGFSLPVACRLNDRKIPFIYHTARPDFMAVARSADWPSAKVLAKPIQMERLVATLATLNS